MAANKLPDSLHLQAYFETKFLQMVKDAHRRPIVWADTLQAIGDVLPPNAVIEVWNNLTLLDEALASGRDALLALGWYLDRQVPVDNTTHWFWLDTWADMYAVNPTGSSSSGSNTLS
jgi:hypothetical protein